MTTQQLLESAIAIHKKKSQDYTTDAATNPMENFERCALVASWFRDDIDKVFTTLITVKLARLAVLLSTERTPNNESIEDTFIDLITYSALWGSKRLRPTVAELDAILNSPSQIPYTQVNKSMDTWLGFERKEQTVDGLLERFITCFDDYVPERHCPDYLVDYLRNIFVRIANNELTIKAS